MNRIEERMKALSEKSEKAFITYVTAGLPDYDKTAELVHIQEKAGVDVIELGVAFSDPIADGPVIQDASYRALLAGADIEKTFDLVKRVRGEGAELPVILMLYTNTIYHYGIKEFLSRASEVGVDGLIVPDMPFEEQAEIRKALGEGGYDIILIQLVSPVSKARVPGILEDARGFVYCVSAMGVTGQAGEYHKNIADYLASVKSVSKIPVMMGFGITSPSDVAPFIGSIDGCIVGTHFIKLLEEEGYAAAAAEKYCSDFKKGLVKLS